MSTGAPTQLATGTAARPLVDALVGRYLEAYPDEAARSLERLGPPAITALLAGRARGAAAEVLRRLNPDDAALALAAGAEEDARELLTALDPARAANLVARLDDRARERLLRAAPPSVGREIREILAYPAGTAGSLMDARVTTLAPSSVVAAALALLRRLPERRIADVMLADAEGRLAGVVALRQLVGAAPERRLDELATPAIAVQPMAPREEVVELLQRHELTSLPVVDLQGRLVGILRHDALVDATEQDATSDLQTMVGASREERALSPATLAVRTRLPWLHVNLATAFLASAVVGLFEGTISKITALAVLLPLVAGQSGNTGAQALAVTMRGLALREIRASHWLRVVRKELLVGVANGVVIALVTGAGVFVWSRNLALAGVIAVAMVLSMGVASLAGASIPVLLVRLRRDPATASSIILTTITDVVGFMSFLGLATLAARWILPH